MWQESVLVVIYFPIENFLCVKWLNLVLISYRSIYLNIHEDTSDVTVCFLVLPFIHLLTSQKNSSHLPNPRIWDMGQDFVTFHFTLTVLDFLFYFQKNIITTMALSRADISAKAQ